MIFSKETKIGFILAVGIALAFWGINYLKGKDFFASERLVYAMYNQVEGLASSNPVSVNGMKVGLVRKLVLMDDMSGRILVSMRVSNNVRIPKNSIAEIYSTDILGSKGIRFILGNGTDNLEEKDTVRSSIQPSLPEEVSAQVAPIKQKTENLISSLDSVLVIVRSVFNEKTKNNLRASFESISHSLQSIESVAQSMDTVLAKQGKLKSIFFNLDAISSNIRNNNDKITLLIENFAAISDTIAKARISETLEQTRKTLEQTAAVMQKINQGEGTLGQLANNDSLYSNVNSTAMDLDKLLIDFREHPRKYLNFSLINFGKK